MAVINMTMKHGRTLVEARSALEQAVNDLKARFGLLVRRVDWAADRNRVRVEGTGFWVELTVDPTEVHGTGDIPALGGLLGGPLATGIKQIMKQTFEKQLPGRTTP